MTIDGINRTSPASDQGASVNDAHPEGIISVNDRGRRRGSGLAPFVAIGGIALVVLIGGLASFNILKAKLSGPKAAPAGSSAAPTALARDFATETPPPLPGTTEVTSGSPQAPACQDGSAGNELRGQDGVIVRNAAGQSLRVCPNGQVVGVTASPSANAQPIPVVGHSRSGGGDTREVADRERPSESPMMLNDGKYAAATILTALANPQGSLGTMLPDTATVAPKPEGLLTGPRSGTLEAELIPSTTPLVQAARLGNLNLLLPKGRTIDCGMSMRIVSSLAGQASCVVTSNVYSANGKVLLIERGSEAVGEYRSGVSIGQKRLFVLWTRIITPAGVVINLNSPGADELGSNGLTGKVDNHWFERIGSAFLLSTIQDAIQYEVAQQQTRSGGTTLVLGSTTQAGNQMAERVLSQTINIPPTIYKNQGDRAVIYVARDLDFSNVYRLRAKP